MIISGTTRFPFLVLVAINDNKKTYLYILKYILLKKMKLLVKSGNVSFYGLQHVAFYLLSVFNLKMAQILI